MKLRTGKHIYSIPSMSQIYEVFIEGNQPYNQGLRYALRHTSLEDFSTLDEELYGFPTVFAIDIVTNKIRFWPTPDKPYEVIGRYYPPIQEF